MASSRRTGLNEAVSTYGAGQTYTVLATWESDTDVNNTSGGGQSPVLACLAAQYDDSVTLNNATNDATHFRTIRPQAGNFHTGVRDTGVRFYSTADSNTIAMADAFEQIQDLCVKTTQNSATGRIGISVGSGTTDAAVVGCIVNGCVNAGAGSNSGISQTSAGTNRAFYINCLSENNENINFSASSTASVAPVWYNCTAIGGVNGFTIGANATSAAINCLAHGSSSADWAGSLDSGSNNASEDGTALGTSPRTSQTFTFVNAGSNDYHLAGNDAGAKGFGTSLAVDGTYPFDDDIDRQLFNTWSIGFDSVIIVTAIGLNSETESALAMTVRKTKAIGINSETDTVFSISYPKTIAIGLNSETDLAQSMTAVSLVVLGLASETDVAQTIARLKFKAIGLNTETDATQSMAALKSKLLGLNLEADLAQSVALAGNNVLGIALETDSAQPFTSAKRLIIGINSETDLAQSATARRTYNVAQASETDLAQVLGQLKAKLLGLNSETDAVQSAEASKSRSLGLNTETDEPFQISSHKRKAIGIVSESDLAQAVSAARRYLLGIASESDLVFSMAAAKAKTLGLAAETDLALEIALLTILLPGLEYTSARDLLHFTSIADLLHYTATRSRKHFTSSDELLEYTSVNDRLHYTSVEED